MAYQQKYNGTKWIHFIKNKAAKSFKSVIYRDLCFPCSVSRLENTREYILKDGRNIL